MFTKEEIEQTIKIHSEIEEYAEQLIQIFCKVRGLPVDKGWIVNNIDSHEICFETYCRGNTHYEYIPTRYLWSGNAESDMTADWEKEKELTKARGYPVRIDR